LPTAGVEPLILITDHFIRQILAERKTTRPPRQNKPILTNLNTKLYKWTKSERHQTLWLWMAVSLKPLREYFKHFDSTLLKKTYLGSRFDNNQFSICYLSRCFARLTRTIRQKHNWLFFPEKKGFKTSNIQGWLFKF